MLDLPALEQWLWDAACVVRGPLDAPKFKDYILPLVFLKRLSDVFEDEVRHLAEDLGKNANDLVEADHKLVRFYVPELARWPAVAKVTRGVGEYLTDAMRAVAKQNPKLQGVIDMVDFNATAAGQRIVDDQRLLALVQTLGKYRLGLADVEPDILGRAYEYLLRDQPGRGRTIIEKFEGEAGRAAYGIALLTPDDLVSTVEGAYSQPRPNVIFELGWFFGRLGRDRVCILFKEGTSLHSDLAGISRVSFPDSVEQAVLGLEGELRAAGLVEGTPS